jgi:hypothetical protein
MRRILLASILLSLAGTRAWAQYDGEYRPAAPSWASPKSAALGPWRLNFDIGAGPTSAAGPPGELGAGSNFQIGAGYNFTPKEGVVLEYMNSRVGISQTVLNQYGAVSGVANVWALTINPVYRFRLAGPIGAYVIAGGGYYERDARYNEPGTGFVPGFHGGFYGPGTIVNREPDGAGGVNAGAGLTWNWGWGTKFFVEARYHRAFTAGYATQIIPVTFGLRW